MAVRVGVAGTGHWARTVHAAGVAGSRDATFTGVWGRDLGKATTVGEEFGVRGFDDFDAFLDKVDAVSLAVPPQVQASLALRAAEAGKHLLLEKPIATDLAAADRLVEAASAVSTVVFFTGRFVPLWEEWLAALQPGTLHGGRVEWLTSMQPDSPYASSVWRKEEGALWDVGPHALSFLLPALGPVVSVAGAPGFGDHVQLVLTHEGGATSSMSLSMTMPTLAQRVSVEFWGEDGWLPQPDNPRDVEAAYAGALSELVVCISDGVTEHRCDVRFGREVVKVLARCEQALATPLG